MNVEVEDKSLHLALLKATIKLGVSHEQIGYEVLDKQMGFLGLFCKKIRIKAWRKKFEKSSKTRKSNSLKQTKALPEASVVAEMKEFCSVICQKTFGKKVYIKTKTQDERLILEIQDSSFSDTKNRMLRFADALEHLLKKHMQARSLYLSNRFSVDINGLRETKESDLISLAKDMSEKVVRNQKPIVLNNHSASDRKVIHMTLDRDRRVYTKSVGSGHKRCLMILPSRARQNGQRKERRH
ncbi:MAG: hypothetical protein CMP11_08600 [Zetaproteobacteria bacterium]|nr:hypothetical protein [Pseudobdellovibrionaceae bacterium]|tara:strand:+ start:1112 stop:1831 length:720 start_codon:yes stop_codon:yes gene_type:complete